MQLLKEELSRKEAAAQRRVERVQKECQAVRSELKSHVSDKQRILDELEQLRLTLLIFALIKLLVAVCTYNVGVFAIGLNFPGVENSNLLKTQGIITCSTVGGIPLQLLCVHL